MSHFRLKFHFQRVKTAFEKLPLFASLLAVHLVVVLRVVSISTENATSDVVIFSDARDKAPKFSSQRLYQNRILLSFMGFDFQLQHVTRKNTLMFSDFTAFMIHGNHYSDDTFQQLTLGCFSGTSFSSFSNFRPQKKKIFKFFLHHSY